MPETDRDEMPGLVGGISTQEPHQRYPGQVGDAINAVFNVEDGASKRSGSRFQFLWDDLPTDRDTKIHPIVRAANGERYLVGYGASTLRVRTIAGTRCTVFSKAAPLAYLGTSVADRLRLSTIADTTIVTNKDVATGTKSSAAYQAVRTVRTFSELLAVTPAIGDRVQVSDSSEGIAPGYWRYQPGVRTYATLRLADVGATYIDPTTYSALAVNPMGFTVFFTTVPTAIVGATWTQATKTVTKAGAFANYTHEPNRYLNITAGTGFTAGHFLITGKVSNDAVTIEHPAPPADNVNTAATDIGISVAVSVAMNTENIADMHTIAAVFQREIRAGGAPNACVGWTSKFPNTGWFTITHPYGGSSSTFPAAGAIRGPAAGTNDLTNAAGEPFLATGYVVTAGTGRDALSTSEPVTRWLRVAGPAQESAEYDAEKMPCSLVRVHAGGVWAWVNMTTQMAPFAWYRLGEVNGQTAYDEFGNHTGTMPAAPARVFPGLLAEGDDGARLFDSNNKHLWLGTLDDFGSRLNRPITIEARLKSNHATKGALFACGKTSDGTTQSLHIWTNTTDGAADSQGRWWFRLSDRAGRKLTGNIAANTGVTNNANHTVAVSFDPANNGIKLWLDGASVAVTITENQTPSDFVDFTNDTACTAFAWDPDGDHTATNLTYLRCTADEFVIHCAMFNDEIAAARHNQAINAAYAHAPTFVLKESPWSVRPSGDQNTNPVPQAIAAGKPVADVTTARDRLFLLVGDQALGSADGDYFLFYNEDPAALSDADPIVRSAPGDQVSELDFAVPIQKSLVVLSASGQQFQLAAPEGSPFSQSTCTFDAGTHFEAVPGVRPAVSSSRLFFAGGGKWAGHLVEYFYSDVDILLGGQIVSSHVRGLLPNTVKRVVASTGEANKVVELSTDGNTLYAYGYYYVGREKVQSAWGKWAFDATFPTIDMACIGDELYLLRRGQGQNVVENHSLVRPPQEAGTPYLVHLDRLCAVNGVFGGVNTTWALPGGLSDTTINQVVKADGTVVTVTSNGPTLTAVGNHAGAAVAGRSFTMSIQLTRHFIRNYRGAAILSAMVNIRSLVLSHINSGSYDVVARMPLRADRSRTMTPSPKNPPGTLVEESGVFEANLNGDAKLCKHYIESSSPRPCCITGFEWLREGTVR